MQGGDVNPNLFSIQVLLTGRYHVKTLDQALTCTIVFDEY